MMQKFEQFHTWVTNNMGETTIELAKCLHSEFYGCNCMSCEYRKEHGLMPVNQNGKCTVPKSLDEAIRRCGVSAREQ